MEEEFKMTTFPKTHTLTCQESRDGNHLTSMKFPILPCKINRRRKWPALQISRSGISKKGLLWSAGSGRLWEAFRNEVWHSLLQGALATHELHWRQCQPQARWHWWKRTSRIRFHRNEGHSHKCQSTWFVFCSALLALLLANHAARNEGREYHAVQLQGSVGYLQFPQEPVCSRFNSTDAEVRLGTRNIFGMHAGHVYIWKIDYMQGVTAFLSCAWRCVRTFCYRIIL